MNDLIGSWRRGGRGSSRTYGTSVVRRTRITSSTCAGVLYEPGRMNSKRVGLRASTSRYVYEDVGWQYSVRDGAVFRRRVSSSYTAMELVEKGVGPQGPW